MNAPRVFSALAGALIASASYGSEATQFIDPPTQLTREEVKAGIPTDMKARLALSRGRNAFDEPANNAVRAREDVRAERKLAARHYGMSECPYVGG